MPATIIHNPDHRSHPWGAYDDDGNQLGSFATREEAADEIARRRTPTQADALRAAIVGALDDLPAERLRALATLLGLDP